MVNCITFNMHFKIFNMRFWIAYTELQMKGTG